MKDISPAWHLALTPSREERLRERLYVAVSSVALMVASVALGLLSSVPGLLIQAAREAALR